MQTDHSEQLCINVPSRFDDSLPPLSPFLGLITPIKGN